MDQETTYSPSKLIWLNRTLLALFFTSFIVLGLDSTQAASLDFGWGTPIEFNEKEKIDKKGERPFIAWPIQITNHTGKRWLPHLDIVAVTDTGKQYSPLPTMKVSSSGEVAGLANLEGHLFPSVTRNAIAVFEKIDPQAKVIRFYVGGLIDLPERKMKYLRITYRRSPSGWKWEDSGALESF